MPGEARIIREKMSPEELAQLASETFGDMLKLVVDVKKGVLAAGGALHADGEALLVEEGASQENVWGANYFPQRGPGMKLEYSAFINIRPSHENTDQMIQSQQLRMKMKEIVEQWVGPA